MYQLREQTHELETESFQTKPINVSHLLRHNARLHVANAMQQRS